MTNDFYCECCFKPGTALTVHKTTDECDPKIKARREKELEDIVAIQMKEHMEWAEQMIKEGVLFRK